ncbi:MAG: DUF4186 domain-containing protein [Isosphaeraceae bacterium]|nr:DUF4186 domain-containing protein [Isosphaeraceae bacterium]
MIDDVDRVLERLQRSDFRRRFRLRLAEKQYLDKRGLEVILSHGQDFIEQRLAPAEPQNDGKQTPMRNHPVFVAQHATATCCRGCLEKWHQIPKGRALTAAEKDYVLEVIRRWILAQHHL